VRADGTEIHQTYTALLEQARHIAGGLLAHGFAPGDRVLLQLSAGEEFIPAFWGCVLAGVVPVPTSVPPLYDQPHAAIVRLRQAWRFLDRPRVLTSAALASALTGLPASPDGEPFDVLALEALPRELPPSDLEPAPDDLALLLLTSGSTGEPKAVMLSHRNILGFAIAAAERNGFTAADVSLNWLPLDHVGGLVMSHVRAVVACCRHIHVPTELILQAPLRWLDLVHRHRVSNIWAPNFAFGLVNARADDIASKSWDLRCLRSIVNAGESITRPTAERFLELLAPFGLQETAMHPAWGMSETSSAVTFSDRFRVNRAAAPDAPVEVGAPVPGMSLRIVDAEDRVVAEGEPGALQVQGMGVTAGYFNDPERSRAAFTPDGWLRTGDLGVLCDGRLTITGREKEIIILRGVNYSSHSIEAVVETVEGVETSFTAACAVRAPGEQSDHLAVFWSTASRSEAEGREIERRIRATLRREVGVAPDHLVLLPREHIPKTAIGKIQREALRRQFEAGEFDAERPAPAARSSGRAPGGFQRDRTLGRPAMYRRVWCEVELPAEKTLPPGQWLVFADAHGLGDRLAAKLRSESRACAVVTPGTEFSHAALGRFTVDPFRAGDYDHLLAALASERSSPRHTVHAWTYNAGSSPAGIADLERALELGLHSTLLFTQALARAQAGEAPHRLWVLSDRAHEVVPGEGAAGEKTGLASLLRSLQQELAWLQCAHVDVAGMEIESDLTALERELRCGEMRPEVAWRNGRRSCPRLTRVEPEEEGAPGRSGRRGPPIVAGGTYVLSGGLGGIGSVLVHDLLARNQARLLVIGRTPAADVEERLQRLRSLGGELLYAAADIADRVAIGAAVRDAERRWGRRFDGVFHLAGAYEAHSLGAETRGTLTRSLRAKVVGAWVLHEIIRDAPGTLMVHFASLLGYFGGAHHAAYAAANACLEGLAHQQRALGLRSSCLLWSPWTRTGMNRGADFESAAGGKGYLPLTPAHAMGALWAALCCDEAHVLIGLDQRNVNIRPHLVAPSPELPARDADWVEPRTQTERRLAQIWEELLELPRVGALDNFFEIGGDSLEAAALFARIEESFGKDLPIAALFRAPTLEQLARVLEQESEPAGRCRLVPLQTTGSRPPLFCLPGAEDAIVFRALAAAIDPDQPLYCIQAPGLDGRSPTTPFASIEEIAAQFVQEICGVQAHGPYFLCGHCLGGFLAYEVAQQLRARSEEVAMLALIDTLVDDSPTLHVVAPWCDRLEHFRRQLSGRSWWDKLRTIAEKTITRRENRTSLLRRRQALAAIETLHRSYRLQPYPGRLTLFLAADSFLNRHPERDPRRTWEHLAEAGADQVVVPGDHETLLHSPFVQELARALDERIRAATIAKSLG
jgi:acyl-CoA synthetase (AMP-forming)/AMP-acid ligase II/thioesterase domain-containing protein/NAD(P)-dependent dehydrogenase (short-subunit alcohol dehydrogenase family)/acyl carrier protein